MGKVQITDKTNRLRECKKRHREGPNFQAISRFSALSRTDSFINLILKRFATLTINASDPSLNTPFRVAAAAMSKSTGFRWIDHQPASAMLFAAILSERVRVRNILGRHHNVEEQREDFRLRSDLKF